MGVKIDIATNRPMFFKAYEHLKGKYPNISQPGNEQEVAAIWLKEFSVLMSIDETSKKFYQAEFASESDASVFILRWS